MKQIMRVAEAAEEWGLEREEVEHLIRQGQVTPFVVGGCLFVKPQQFEAELLRAAKELAPDDPRLGKLLEQELGSDERP